MAQDMGDDEAGVPPGEGPRRLSFEQTVPRSLVHRAALAEVYVADSLQTGDDEFTLAVQVPRGHCVWFDRRVSYHDPLATAEAARQGVYVIVHRHVGLPAGMTFNLQRLELGVEDLDGYRDTGAPLQGLLTLRVVKQTHSRGALGSMSLDGDIAVDGKLLVRVGGDVVFLAADDFAALRAYHRRRNPPESAPPPAVGPALDPAACGRLDRRNSVLGEAWAEDGTERFPLVIDERHPSFFDHGYDHAPGPLIVEAYRQAAIVSAHRAGALASPVCALVGLSASFKDFAELDVLIEVSAVVDERSDDGTVAVDVALYQFDKVLSTGRVTLRPYPDASPGS